MESSGEEEEPSTNSYTSDSNGEISSSLTKMDASEEEEELTENSSILFDSDDNDSSSSSGENIGDSSDEELFVSTFTRAEFLATYIHQNFSLPDPIMEYIAKNIASLEVYQKLIQTCKYFFLKNPILVVPILSLAYKADGWYAEFDGKRILVNDISSKFWVTDSIFVSNSYQDSHDQNILSNVAQKFFRCDNEYVFVNHQNISINDLILLASKSEIIKLISSTVVEDDGSVVPFEKIFASLPLVKDFIYDCADYEMIPQIVTSETVEELIKIPHFATLKSLELNVHRNFNRVPFDEFFKNNKYYKRRRIQLHVWAPVSE